MHDSYHDNKYALSEIVCTICIICQQLHLFENKYECSHRWDYSTVLLYPNPLEAPLPSENMPEAVQKIYNEARAVLPHSPSASCLLLRKALETLLFRFTNNDHLETSIKLFSQQNAHLQSALEPTFHLIRVYGNDGGHYRELDLSDDKETALILFDSINFIVSSVITQQLNAEKLLKNNPKAKKVVKELYPESEQVPF
jgi:hypothetical protein